MNCAIRSPPPPIQPEASVRRSPALPRPRLDKPGVHPNAHRALAQNSLDYANHHWQVTSAAPSHCATPVLTRQGSIQHQSGPHSEQVDERSGIDPPLREEVFSHVRTRGRECQPASSETRKLDNPTPV